MVLKKSQSTLEYAALIAVATAALLGMQLYFRRGVEGKIKDSADSVGTQYDVKTGGYYSRTELDTAAGGDKIQISASGNYSFSADGDIDGGIDGPNIGEVKRYTDDGGYTMKSVDRTTTDGDASITFGDLNE